MTRLEEAAYMQWLLDNEFESPKPLLGKPGYWGAIRRLLFHYSIQGGRIGDKLGIEIRYCYTADRAAVQRAFDAWDGSTEPEGWQRHPGSGRRRQNANPELEYIDP